MSSTNFQKENLSAYTIKQLRYMLKQLQLLTTGSKAELIFWLNAVKSEELADVIAKLWQKEKKKTSFNVSTSHSDIDVSPLKNFEERVHDSIERREHELLRRERDLEDRETRLLRRERELEEKEIRLMRREKDMEEQTVNFSRKIDIHVISNLLSEFNGENDIFTEWKKQAEFLRYQYNLDEKLMKILVAMRMKGRALSWFHSKAQYIQLNIAELFEEMERKFDQKKLSFRSETEEPSTEVESTRVITLSPELAAIMDAKQMTLCEIIKKMRNVISEKNLYDPENKQFVICNEELMKITGVKRFRIFDMIKYIKNHLID